VIQVDLEGKKKDAHWGDKSSSANGRLCPNPASSRVLMLCYLRVLVRYSSVPNLLHSLVINVEGSRLFNL
jgi:hypothetical protein